MKKEIFILSFVRMLTAAGYVISVPFLNIFLYNERGIPMKIVGLCITAAALTGSILRIYSGRLIDKFSSILVMNLGLISRILAFLLFSILVLFPSPVYLFFFAFLLNSIGFSFYGTASDTYVGEYIEEKERPRSYGIIRIGANIGWGIGPLLGGFLSNISYFLLFLISTFLAIIGFLINFIFVKGKRDKKKKILNNSNFKNILKDKNFLIFLIASFLIFLVVGQLISSLPVFARYKGLSNLYVGYLFSVNGLMVVFFQYLISSLFSKFSNKKGIIIGSFLYFLGYLSFSWANSFISFVLGVIIFTIGEMITLPLITTLTTKIAPENSKGTYLGILGFFEGLGWAISPFIGGILIDIFIDKPLFLWSITSSFAIFAILIYFRVKEKNGEN
ncbi:MAG: MFS transporter [candidate division WOR-3 bacterium]